MRLPFIATAALLLSCTSQDQSAGSLTVEAFAERMDDAGAQLLDVRTSAEFSSGKLANARNLDWTNGQVEAAAPQLDNSKPVLLYCASGRRSAAAGDYLREQGFTDVVDLAGGIGAWRSAGKPVE